MPFDVLTSIEALVPTSEIVYISKLAHGPRNYHDGVNNAGLGHKLTNCGQDLDVD